MASDWSNNPARGAGHSSCESGAMRKIVKLCSLLFVSPLLWNSHARAQQAPPLSELDFHSSNSALNEAFRWAREQALAYVRTGSDSIGPWYEAALPGRNAFCMRDVSHQTTGAAALGLFAANRNMLHRFADSAAASRNWAAYWEIDGKGTPSPADYRSDTDFWFNLPANFDMLDAIVRMWRWTGDESYRNDPRLQLFFRATLTDYIAQWQLQPETILTRPRIANQLQAKGEFVASRGIPSYTEGPKDFIFGADLLAAEYRAIRSYREIALTPEDKELAVRLQATANSIQHLLEKIAWSQEHGHFNGVIQKSLRGYGSGDTLALYFNAVKDPGHLHGALDYVSDSAYWKTINIEEESYVPIVLFRNGRTPAAYQVLLDLAARGKPRREYPEVSYAVIAALVSGAMGIEPAAMGDAYDVQTLPQPMTKTDELSVASLRIKGNVVDVSHFGGPGTRFVNRKGPILRWRAVFEGTIDKLQVNERLVHAEHGLFSGGTPVSWTTVNVPPGESIVVSQARAGEDSKSTSVFPLSSGPSTPPSVSVRLASTRQAKRRAALACR